MSVTSCDTVLVCLASVFAEWDRSLSGLLNAASVCVWILCWPQVCIYIYTCQHQDCWWRSATCSRENLQDWELLSFQREPGVTGSFCFPERFSGKSEILVILSCKQEECCAVVFPCSCRFFCIMDPACLLWWLYYNRRCQIHFVFTLKILRAATAFS